MSIIQKDSNGNNVSACEVTAASQILSCTTSTQQSTAFGANTTLVRVSTTVGHCHIQFGSNPTASITTSLMMPAETTEIFKVTPGHKMAFIRDAGTAVSTVCLTELV